MSFSGRAKVSPPQQRRSEAFAATPRAIETRRGDAPMVGAADLIRQLPENYLASTSPLERLAHFELYKRFEAANHGEVMLSWVPLDDGSGHSIVHAVFRDVPGSLSTLTNALAEEKIDAKRVAAFTTPSGVAVDSLEVAGIFDAQVADRIKTVLRKQISAKTSPVTPRRSSSLETIKKILHVGVGTGTSSETSHASPGRGEVGAVSASPGASTHGTAALASTLGENNELARQLPPNYLTTTTPAERLAHLELFRKYSAAHGGATGDEASGGATADDDTAAESDVELSWAPIGDGTTHVYLYLVFRDTIGSLSAITGVLREYGINILRVAAYQTNTGVAIDSFELSDLDDPSAEMLRARLNALIHTGDPNAALPRSASSAFAYNGSSFRVSWRGRLGAKRGNQELTIGDTWAALGQAALESGSIHFAQPDFYDDTALHLGFFHKQKMRTLVIFFVDGPEQCTRAYALLSRLVRPTNKSLHDGQRFRTITAADTEAAPAGGVSTSEGGTPSGLAGLANFGGVPHMGNATSAAVSAWGTAWCTFRCHFPGGLQIWSILTLLATCLVAAVSLGFAVHVHFTWRDTDPRNFQSAVCTVDAPVLLTDHLDAEQRCVGHPVLCYRSFFVAYPAWRVRVTPFDRYKDVDVPIVGTQPLPLPAADGAERSRSFEATALLSVFRWHRTAPEQSIRPGEWCAGQLGWDRNRTYHACRQRLDEWFPALTPGDAYACYVHESASVEGVLSTSPAYEDTVYLDLTPPTVRGVEVLVASLLASIALTLLVGHLYVRYKIWLAPRRLSDETAANAMLSGSGPKAGAELM